MIIDQDDIDDEIEADARAEARKDAKDGMMLRWHVERHDNSGGSISYEVWSENLGYRVLRINDSDNPCAKRDCEHIAELHNTWLRGPR